MGIANWVNVTLRRGLESGSLKRAAVEGRKGAGSFKLGDNPTAETSSKKVTETAKSKMKSSAKRVSSGTPSNVKKPKFKKETTGASTKTTTAKSKPVKKTAGAPKASKPKAKKTAAVAASKKPTTAAKKP